MSDAFGDIGNFVVKWVGDKRDNARMIAEDLKLDAAANQREQLLARHAQTNWGWARVHGYVDGPAGPKREHAGRYEEGTMYESISSETRDVGKRDIEIRWGWQNPLQYFLDQEHGRGKIPAAESLAYSLAWAEEELRERLQNLL